MVHRSMPSHAAQAQQPRPFWRLDCYGATHLQQISADKHLPKSLLYKTRQPLFSVCHSTVTYASLTHTECKEREVDAMQFVKQHAVHPL